MSLAAAALVAAPVLSLLWTAASPAALAIWPHLVLNVVPAAAGTTALLLLGVALLTGAVGVGAAWLVTQYEFRGRASLSWLLAMPLAVPTYLVAYVYVDFLGFQGPLQTLLRALTGWRSLRDYWFPDPRNLVGAILVMSFVLYPYVYLSVRALFALQSAAIVESARTLGAGPRRLFLRVGLPLARPALAAGLTLALLEALNDIGASEHLGVRTLTLSIYTTWLSRNSLAGAAQIACVMLAIVVLLILVESRLRGQRRFALSVRQPRPVGRMRLNGGRGALAAIACAIPVLLGSGIPVGFLAWQVWKRRSEQFDAALLLPLGNALLLSAIAALSVVALGLAVAMAKRSASEAFVPALARIASLGYALPGTVLALGLLVPVAAIDNLVADLVKALTGASPGLLMIGSGAALIVAYVVRFLVIAIAGGESGLSRIPQRIDEAARVLGASRPALLRSVHWPLARPAMAAAALVVFIDCLKELPATLLLRPLNFETPATLVYGHASRGSFEDGALAALLIVLAGLYPAAVLARTGVARRSDARPGLFRRPGLG